jgi:hypothetical protein
MMTNTIAHDSATCTLGLDGGKCELCVWADEIERMERGASLDEARRRELSDCGFESRLNPFPEWSESIHVIEQSATAIHARRAALLERADIHSPTEGAIALADAHLQAEEWWRQLSNNAMQDAAVLELAGEVEEAVGSYLQRRQEEW